jgi:hypothetical protein
VPRNALKELKTLLARVYREGDQKLKVAIITGALEHLFGDSRILRFFADWKDDPELRAAYFEALCYSEAEKQ